MESRIRFTVDEAHCEQAATELLHILRSRAEARARRRYAAWHQPRLVRSARRVGLVAASLGLAFTVGFHLYDTSAWARPPSAGFIPVFAAALVFLLFQPRLEEPLREWSFRVATLGTRRTVERVMREARRLAPFEADYDLKGDLMVYSRGKDGTWRIGWSRNLGTLRHGGLAVQSGSITVLFRTRSALLPWAVILQRDREWSGALLREVGIATDIVDGHLCGGLAEDGNHEKPCS